MIGPRALTAPQVATLLGRSVTWFQRHRAALESQGFPAPIGALGLRWDGVAVHRWLDAQSGQPAPEDAEAELIRRANRMADAAALAAE